MIQILSKFEGEVFILFQKGHSYSEIVENLKNNSFLEINRDIKDCKRLVDNAIWRLKRKLGDYYEFESKDWKR